MKYGIEYKSGVLELKQNRSFDIHIIGDWMTGEYTNLCISSDRDLKNISFTVMMKNGR